VRVALRFGYDGRKFHGYARQPDVRTVEGDILKALDRIEARHIRFRSASRTDKGVSAISNVIAFDTNFRPEELPRALNANLSDIFFHGWSEVDIDFDPRKARQRWYRYHLFGEHDIDTMKGVAELFIGKHDFSSFARMEAGRNPIRKIDSMEFGEAGGMPYIDIKAQSFLWQMVRRIVGAMLSIERGERSPEDVEKALDGERVVFGIAPPEPLFLMSVDYSSASFTKTECRKLDGILNEIRITRMFMKYMGTLPDKETL